MKIATKPTPCGFYAFDESGETDAIGGGINEEAARTDFYDELSLADACEERPACCPHCRSIVQCRYEDES